MNNKNNQVKSSEIRVDRGTVLSIVSLATKEITGVYSMDNSLARKVHNKFCSNYFDGAKVTYDKKGGITIDVYINVLYNYNVAEISYKVQQNIRNSLNTMIELDINEINVHVVGVSFEEEKEDNL